MSLLHVLAAVLAVLLFVVRHRCALLSTHSGKPRSIQQKGSQYNRHVKPALSFNTTVCAGAVIGATFDEDLDLFVDPKYKRDPEIDVDSEQIGYYPMG